MEAPVKQKPIVVIRSYLSSDIRSKNSVCQNENNNNKEELCDYREDKTSNKSTELFSAIKRSFQKGSAKMSMSQRDYCSSLSSSGSSASALASNKSLSQIRGPSGSVRGHRDVVRKSLENIGVAEYIWRRKARNFGFPKMASFYNSNLQEKPWQTNKKLNHLEKNLEEARNFQMVELKLERLCEEEQDLCVAYTTSLGVIRRTFEDSKLMRSILSLNLIKFEERDIYLNQEYRDQLRSRCESIRVPVLFVHGQEVGGVAELESLNESGKLAILLAKFKMTRPAEEMCKCCGNVRFIACQNCNGSRKSSVHHFKFNSIALRCTKCNKNDGIIHCPLCCSDRSKDSKQTLSTSKENINNDDEEEEEEDGVNERI